MSPAEGFFWWGLLNVVPLLVILVVAIVFYFWNRTRIAAPAPTMSSQLNLAWFCLVLAIVVLYVVLGILSMPAFIG